MAASNITVVTENEERIPLTVDLAADTVAGVSERLSETLGHPAALIRLNLAGVELARGESLASVGVENGAELSVTLEEVEREQEPQAGETLIRVEEGGVERDGGVEGGAENAAATPVEEEREEGGGEEAPPSPPRAAEGNEVAVCVLHPRGDPFTVYLPASANVLALKRRLEEEHGYGGQLLRLTCHRVTPDDHQLIGELQQASPEAGLMVEVVAPIQITLHLYIGSVVPITVPSDASVYLLCQTAQRSGTVPYHLQQVLYGDRRMDAGHRLSEYGVRDGAQVFVELNDHEVMIFLKTLTGETIMMRVTPQDTVADVKRKVQVQEGIPAESQRLIFVGQQMDDRRRLLEYRVEHENAIHVVIRQGTSYQVFVDVPPNRTHIFELEPTDLLSTIKHELEEREALPARFQRLYLGDTLLSVDDATLEECGVGPNAVLRFAREQGRHMQIFVGVPRDSDRFSVWAKPADTVRFVKEIVALREGVPVEKQELFFARRKLDDDRTLGSYYIESNHMLHMEVVLPKVIHVVARTPDGHEVRVDIPEDQTVLELKDQLGMREGWSAQEQQLFRDGVELDDAKTLAECELPEECSLTVVATSASQARLATAPLPIVLFVKSLAGKTLTLTISPTDTVYDLKTQIFQKEGIPESQQCLVASGRQLSNAMSVRECGVQSQSVLHLVMRVPSVDPIHVVVEASGRSFSLNVASNETVDELRARILELEGLMMEEGECSVEYEGRVLDDAIATLNSYGISDGSKLQLVKS